jgi:hypothetical protein
MSCHTQVIPKSKRISIDEEKVDKMLNNCVINNGDNHI